jgi:hypothetical protein
MRRLNKIKFFMILKIKRIFILFLFFLFFVFFIKFFLVFVNFICDFFSCLKPAFLKNNDYLKLNSLENFCYFFGFLDYSSVLLPEVIFEVGSNLNNGDIMSSKSVLFGSFCYNVMIVNFLKFFYIFVGSITGNHIISLEDLLKYIGIESFEINSLFAYYTDVIFLDNDLDLDRYFLNISAEGWFRDS